MNTVEHGLIVIDRAGVVRTWNHIAERMWGLGAEQVVGREFFTLPLGEVVLRTRPAFERMLMSGEAQQVEGIPYAVPGGAEGLARVHIAPVKDIGAKVSAGVAMIWPQNGLGT